MARYKIVGFTGIQRSSLYFENDLNRAARLKEEYSLPFSLENIILIWKVYSEDMCSDWLIDDKESIENAFGVILGELNE